MLLLLAWVIVSCDHKDYKWDIFGEDFETPVLTDQNTIQFMIHPDERLELQIDAKGRTVIEWGDGKMAKVGYGEELDAPSHQYMPGSYRVKIWCEELTGLSIGNDSMVCSDLRFGNCPKLESMYVNSRVESTSLDFSGCFKLKYLTVMNIAGLESVNISQCSELEMLNISSQPGLDRFDVSHNLELQSLDCNNCSLSQLSLEKNTKLQVLDCCENQLTALNLSENRQLNSIYCSENLLEELDLGALSELYSFFCDKNRLTSLVIAPNHSLHILSCSDNLLDAETLDTIILNLPDYSECEGMDIGQIAFYNNPGEKECDANMVRKKKWKIMKQE